MKFTPALLVLSLLLVLFAFANANAQSATTEDIVSVPEPLMFDLVRGLGARQGELEINTLADFPLNNTSVRGVEWAPEVEYALFNNFAIEVEFPFEDGELEAYKMAVQWTMGVSENNKFIHGIQVIAETLRSDDLTEFSFLYVPAIDLIPFGLR